MKYLLFLQWWLIFTVICVMSIFTYYTGFAKEIWIKDSSFISYATYAVFMVCSIYCGGISYEMCKNTKSSNQKKMNELVGKTEVGWFVSELCLTLGMIGTIIGFIMMLNGFNTLDIQNIQTVQALLSQLGSSMATALYTTIVGLVCGSALKLQFFIVSLKLDSIENDKQERDQ